MTIDENIRFEELRPDSWPFIERLFGPNGACAGCWCVWWRVEKHQTWSQMKGESAREMLKKLIAEGKAHGVLAFAGSAPVGWCSFGPRTDFPRLERVKAYARDDIDGVWSVTCFFIHRNWRRKGLARGLLKAAVQFMRERGVKIVEGYPVTTAKDGRKLASGMAWTGPVKIFEELGFRVVQSTNPLKPLVRLKLERFFKNAN